jgi:aspartate racemase
MESLQPKKLGVLGLASRSTLFYLEQLNQQYHAKYGGFSTCPLTLINTNFNDINVLLPNYSNALGMAVKQYLDQLEGVDNIIIPNITLHDAVDRLNAKSQHNYPIIHPVRETLAQLNSDGITQVTLLASQYSMTSPYLLEMFADKGIQVLVPTSSDQQWLDGLRQQVYAGEESLSDLKIFSDYINQYNKDSEVVIACTELSLILPNEQMDVYDMAKIQMSRYFC